MVRIVGTKFNSDFDYLKNDSSNSGTFTIPGSAVVAGGSFAQWGTTITAGQALSLVNTRFRSSKQGNQYYLASVQQSFQRTGTVGGSPAPFTLYFFISHVSGNTIQFLAAVLNPYAGALTLPAGNEIIDVTAKTFKPPNFA